VPDLDGAPWRRVVRDAVADVVKLRDHLLLLARNPDGPLGGRFTTNDLYNRVSRCTDGSPPVSRAAFYTWFGGNGGEAPRQALVECIPAFAQVFGVPEHELWQAAEVLPAGVEVGNSLASSANAIRKVYRALQKTLSDSGLSTAGEALVVDRILHAQLDLEMTVWPVVRGYRSPLHLHSWIRLVPVPPEQGRTRAATTRLGKLSPEQRRDYLRETVLTESLWRALGLRWSKAPPEYADDDREPLFLELPAEERNRIPPERPVHRRLTVDRILVLGPPWSHAELMAALLADALQFGSWDLRYVGLHGREQHVRFGRQRLAEGRSRYVWALAQRVDTMRELRSDVLAAAPGTLVVVLTYGDRLADFAGRALHATSSRPAEALRLVHSLADDLRELTDVVEVHLADEDVLSPEDRIDRHLVSDTIVDLTAEVLNLLQLHRGGPILPRWGDRFRHLRLGDEPRALDVLQGRASTVRWRPLSE
jgi:hypothetical protein